jgi:chromodomain-helicase-DNA-binding protein 4
MLAIYFTFHCCYIDQLVDSDADIDTLITRTEQIPEVTDAKEKGSELFSFGKIWTANKDAVEDLGDDNQTDSWAVTLMKINSEREAVQLQQAELSGRGGRKRAAAIGKVRNKPLQTNC